MRKVIVIANPHRSRFAEETGTATSHAHFPGFSGACATGAIPTGRLDAIIVPATRPAYCLQPASTSARPELSLVVLCSRQTRAASCRTGVSLVIGETRVVEIPKG